VTEQAGHRVGNVFEVDPALMSDHVRQQAMPVWDTVRIVASRTDHLEWMHRHWAATTLSGEALLAELDGTSTGRTSTTAASAGDTNTPRG
jgi:hypothetical protein